MRPRNEELKMQIYEYVKETISREGSSPTLDDIAAQFRCSKPVALKYIDRLIEEDYLSRNGRYQLSVNAINPKMNDAPVYGSIPCGEPMEMNADIEEFVRLPAALFGSGDLYILRASGESMINAGIDDGDLVVIKTQNTAEDGDIAVVLTKEYENTLKRVYFEPEKKRIRLHPENDTMEDFYAKEFEIQGVAKYIIKKAK